MQCTLFNCTRCLSSCMLFEAYNWMLDTFKPFEPKFSTRTPSTPSLHAWEPLCRSWHLINPHLLDAACCCLRCRVISMLVLWLRPWILWCQSIYIATHFLCDNVQSQYAMIIKVNMLYNLSKHIECKYPVFFIFKLACITSIMFCRICHLVNPHLPDASWGCLASNFIFFFSLLACCSSEKMAKIFWYRGVANYNNMLNIQC